MNDHSLPENEPTIKQQQQISEKTSPLITVLTKHYSYLEIMHIRDRLTLWLLHHPQEKSP